MPFKPNPKQSENFCMANDSHPIGALIEKHQQTLLKGWLDAQSRDGQSHGAAAGAAAADLARQFLDQLCRGTTSGQPGNIMAPEWASMRDLLDDFSRARAIQGFSPSETALFVFSLKEPLFEMLRRELGADAEQIGRQTWAVTRLLDALGLYTIKS